LSELLHPQCGDDGHDVCVVAEVKVEGLVKWEGGGHGVEGCVGLGGAGGELVEVVLEPGGEFFDVPDAGGAAGGGGEAVVAVELEVDCWGLLVGGREGGGWRAYCIRSLAIRGR
jgi:hypothetical protein